MWKRFLAPAPLFALVACGGTTATTDVGSQAQATQVAEADGGSRPDGHHHGPPVEAFDACDGKEVDAACSVTFGSETLSGTCAAPPAGAPDARIACRPDHAPAGHDHHGRPPGPPPEEAFSACAGKASGATCSVTFGDRTLEGSCKDPPAGVTDTRLACAPPHPAGAPSQGK